MSTEKKPNVPMAIIGFGIVVIAMITIGALVKGILAGLGSVIDFVWLGIMGCANELGCTHGVTPTWLGKAVIALFNLH